MSSKSEEKHMRILTIYASYSKRSDGYCRTPYIHLSGIWLTKAGFIGDKIKVITSYKSIVIILDEPEL